MTVYISYSENRNKINICEFDLILLNLNHTGIKGFTFHQIAKKINPAKKIIVLFSHLEHIDIFKKAKQPGAYK